MFTINQIIRSAGQVDPGRPAIINLDGSSLSYAQFADGTRRVAGGIAKLAPETGATVAILALNAAPYFEVFLGTMWSARVAVPLNLRWSVKELIYAIEDANVDVLITTGSTAPDSDNSVRHVLRDLDARWLIDGVAVTPGARMLLARLADGRIIVGLPGGIGTLSTHCRTSRMRSTIAACVWSGFSRYWSASSFTPKAMWRCSSIAIWRMPSRKPGMRSRRSSDVSIMCWPGWASVPSTMMW